MGTDAPVTVLHFIGGKYAGSEFPLESDASVVGRSTEVDLVLADDAVSRKHARLYARRGRYWIRDLGSRNGTHVNGEVVSHQCLRVGDRVTIGSSLAKVELRDPDAVSSRRAGEQRRRRANESAARSMTGSIEDIPLMDVLQWLATSRKTGALKVRDNAAGYEGTLYLLNGRVFHASIVGNDVIEPKKALMRMLRWDDGTFELDNSADDSEVPRSIDMSLEYMLMEAVRQQDELKALGEEVPLPGPRDIVRLARPQPKRWRDIGPEDLDFVQDMVEMGGWQQLLDRSPKDDLALYRGLAALKQHGIVEY